MRKLVGIAEARKVDAIAILGDLTESKDRHSAELVNKVVSHITALAEVAPVVVLMGNHDYHNEGHPFFAFLSHMPRVCWIDKVTYGEALPSDMRREFAKCLFLPHTRNHERDWKDVELSGHRFIFAHNAFVGAKLGFGHIDEGIPLDVFPDDATVIAGDIHIPQSIEPVHYVGAPYTVDFGDDYNPRLLLIKGDTFTRVGVSKFPQKRLIEINYASDMEEATSKCNAGDILKVRVNVDDPEAWPKQHRHIVDWCHDHKFIPQLVVPTFTKRKTRKRHRITTNQTDEELVTQYAKRTGLTDNVMRVGVELVRGAK